MKSFYFVIVSLIVLCVVVAACGGSRGAEEQLDRADALIDTRPDSALRVLDSLSLNDLNDAQQARYGLLYTKAASKSNTPLDDNSLIGMAVDYYAGRGDSLEIQSLFYQGYHYSNNGPADSALLILSRAYELAVPAHDYFYAAMSSREMGTVYRRLFMVREGLEWALKAKELFAKAEKPVHAAWMEHLIADALIFSGSFEAAQSLLDSIGHIDFNNNLNFRCRTLLNKVELALQLKSYSKIDSLYAALGEAHYQFSAHDRLNQAKASIESGRYDDAAVYLSQARDLPMSDADSLYFGKMSSLLAAANGDYKTAYELSNGFSEDLMSSDARIMTNPQTKLLTDNYKLKAENRRLQLEKSRQLTIIFIILCLTLFTLAVVLVFYLRARLANKSLEADKAFNDALRLKNELETVELRLKNELALQHKRHEGFVTDVGNLFSRHVDMLQNLAVAFYSKSGNGDKDPVFYRGVEATIRKVQSIDVVNELGAVIDSCYDGWMTRFKTAYPGLKDRQYLLAMYIRIGLNTEAISVLMGKNSIHSLYVEKNKLKKKMLEINRGNHDEFMTDLYM